VPLDQDHDPSTLPERVQFCPELAIFGEQGFGLLVPLQDRHPDVFEPC
jgi:hypothetical protein